MIKKDDLKLDGEVHIPEWGPSCGNCGGLTEQAEDRHYYCANPECSNCKIVSPVDMYLAKVCVFLALVEKWIAPKHRADFVDAVTELNRPIDALAKNDETPLVRTGETGAVTETK